MSASDAAPLPRLGEVYFDVRGNSRTMRLSWYSGTGVAVFSMWQGGTCTGTFRLAIDDLPRMIETLQRGPGRVPDPASAPRRPAPRLPGSAGRAGSAAAEFQPGYADERTEVYREAPLGHQMPPRRRDVPAARQAAADTAPRYQRELPPRGRHRGNRHRAYPDDPPPGYPDAPLAGYLDDPVSPPYWDGSGERNVSGGYAAAGEYGTPREHRTRRGRL